jgi:type IV pilus assembly protein PilM
MRFFEKAAPPLIGLDISSTSVKLLELGRVGERYRVESYAVVPLPANAVEEKNLVDVEAVGAAISRAIRRSGARGKNVAAAVAGSAVITKVISMPASLNDQEMADQLTLEADQYIPYPMEEINMDFEIIGPTENDEEMVDVLLAASRSENVDIRVAACDLAGLNAKIIDVEAFAMESAFTLLEQQLPDNGIGKTIAIVDIGATMTTLSVSHDFNIIYTREQVFGGKQLTDEIMSRYGLSFEEAGLAKRQGGLPDDYETDILQPFKESLAQQVSRALQFFFSSSQHATVDHVVLAGGCASIPGVDQMVEDKLGISTSVANPFANMSLASRVKPESIYADAPALMIACGLAMRRFDAR